MTEPSFILLYVADPTVSAAFYQRLLGRAPIEQSPGFAMFGLSSGVKLGLWGQAGVLPPASMSGGGGELGFPVADHAALTALQDAWTAQGLPILQPITRMDFGWTFVAADPDGHRLRGFWPCEAEA